MITAPHVVRADPDRSDIDQILRHELVGPEGRGYQNSGARNQEGNWIEIWTAVKPDERIADHATHDGKEYKVRQEGGAKGV